jgi:hypothetical protein
MHLKNLSTISRDLNRVANFWVVNNISAIQ